MAAIVGEELLAGEAAAGAEAEAAAGAEAEAAESAEGGVGGRYNRGNPYLRSKTGGGSGSSSAFKEDKKPEGIFTWNNFYNAKSAIETGSQLVREGTQLFSTIYNNYQEDKRLKRNSRENRKDRHRAGIVFRGEEDRDQLVRSNKIPAYYSTSNIKSLLRRGIMPYGWNSEMAIEQGFGKEIFAQEQKAVTERNSDKLLKREKDKTQLRKSLGELENLRNRLKTRKILEFYNQN